MPKQIVFADHEYGILEGNGILHVRIDPVRKRERMVLEQIEARGIKTPAVLAAMRKVHRHLFVQEALADQAYDDRPQPIGHGQTISAPFIVAQMTDLLEVQPGMSVLEIGTGSGYQAAVLEAMGAAVYSVERVPELHYSAKALLESLGCYRIQLKLDDGTLGWPEKGPFDRIIVTAGGPQVPEPLCNQMTDSGIMVIPVGSTKRFQELTVVRKQGSQYLQQSRGGVMFVDLIGEHGW